MKQTSVNAFDFPATSLPTALSSLEGKISRISWRSCPCLQAPWSYLVYIGYRTDRWKPTCLQMFHFSLLADFAQAAAIAAESTRNDVAGIITSALMSHFNVKLDHQFFRTLGSRWLQFSDLVYTFNHVCLNTYNKRGIFFGAGGLFVTFKVLQLPGGAAVHCWNATARRLQVGNGGLFQGLSLSLRVCKGSAGSPSVSPTFQKRARELRTLNWLNLSGVYLRLSPKDGWNSLHHPPRPWVQEKYC